MRQLVIVLLCAALCAVPASAGAQTGAPPPIRHVFVIVLENEDAATTFGKDSPAPFLAKDLPAQGAFIPNYYGIGHASLDNYIAMVSGQAPNPQTQADCQLFTDFVPGTIGSDGQAMGSGCVYPATVQTIADQLAGAGLTWKGYMEDMGKDAARDNGTTCAHPALNSHDGTQSATVQDQYATRHNPFVYFHSIIDGPSCAANDVPLDRLTGDLASATSTASLSFIVPDLCNDGHDAVCPGGGPGGLKAADAFLRTWVPRIITAPAFSDGLLIVTFDEAGSDSSACCDEPTGPNTPAPGGQSGGPGGGRVGAVLVSPYIKHGSTTTKAYNHYSLLRSLEELFALPPLGYAAQQGLASFSSDVYTNPTGAGQAPVTPIDSGGGATTCRGRSLVGKPRHLRAGTLLSELRLARTAHGRRVTFNATRWAQVTVRSAGRVRHLRVHACKSYRIAVAAHGAVRVAANSGPHTERRRLS